MTSRTPKRPRFSAEQTLAMVMDNENEDFDEIPSGSEDENLSDNSDDEAYRPGRDTDDDVSDDDDEEPPGSINDPGPSNQRKRQDPTVQRKWKWSKKDLPPHQTMENQLVPAGPAAVASTPLAMFLALFDDECMDLLVMETNRFRLQAGRTRIQPADKQEFRTFIGICFFMTIVDLPNRRMYWSPRTHQAVVADAMTVNRFEDILSVLHANDNELERKPGQLGYDRLHKVRPLLSLVGMAFERCAEPEKCISVDEQIIPFKGKHSLKVYMLKKPKKWGYKVWVQAGQSGYVHRFEFAGDNVEQQKKVPSSEAVGKSGEVVLKLTDNQPKQSYVFFDNLFASPELLLELKKKDLRATCTIRSNRTRNCPLLCLKDMKKKGRGACDFRSLDDESLMICQWFDNKVVMVASNVHGVEPKFKVRRYDRSQKQYVSVDCPGLIREYNANMGGVDKCDMLLALYRNTQKSRKWYRRIIFHILDLCVVNAWLLYRALKCDATIPLCHFKLDIALALITSRKANTVSCEPHHTHPENKARLSAKNVNLDARFDRVDHFPCKKEMKNSQRCKRTGCIRKTVFMCRKCQVFLCIMGKDEEEDCFYLFHHQ